MSLFAFSSTLSTTQPPPWKILSIASPCRQHISSCFLIGRRKEKASSLRLSLCSAAAKQQQHSGGPVKKKSPPSENANTSNNTNNNSNRAKNKNNKKQKQQVVNKKGFGLGGDDEDNDDDYNDYENDEDVAVENERYQPPPIPNPPAGFVVDDQGRVVLVSNKRIATIVDPTNNFPLECIIRRVFTSSRGDECMLLCPIDMPVQILRSTNVEGWSAVSDDEVEAILPNAAYALNKIHIHLVHSGFCYTARGGFCYTEDDIFEFRTDDGQDVDGLPTEGIEITCFHLDGSHYMVYTPSDPLLFVAVKDQNGQLQIVDDDLLEDPAVISAIDEETEFNALVEEEAALLDSLLGKR